MSTLVVYDAEGYVLYYATGEVRVPVGVPFLWVEVPVGKYVASVDVTREQHEVVFEDKPKSAEQLQIESLQARQEASDAAIGELTLLIMTPQL